MRQVAAAVRRIDLADILGAPNEEVRSTRYGCKNQGADQKGLFATISWSCRDPAPVPLKTRQCVEAPPARADRELFGQDWWPYGIKVNRAAIDALLRYPRAGAPKASLRHRGGVCF